MEVHLLKHIKELTDRLVAVSAPIAEEDQVVTLLGSLPPSYSILVTALEARIDDVKLNFVLTHEDQKQNGQFGRSSGGQTELALVGAQKKGWPRKQIKCFDCGETGNVRRNCPSKKGLAAGYVHTWCI